MTVSQKRYDDEFKRNCVEMLLSGGRQLKPLARELDRLERSAHALFSGLRTVTCDNGCEFLDFNAIERSAREGAARSSSPTPSAPPSAGRTRTPTASSGASSPRDPTSPPSHGRRSSGSRTGSTRFHAKSSTGSPLKRRSNATSRKTSHENHLAALSPACICSCKSGL